MTQGGGARGSKTRKCRVLYEWPQMGERVVEFWVYIVRTGLHDNLGSNFLEG
jgi:hypothetical protein